MKSENLFSSISQVVSFLSILFITFGGHCSKSSLAVLQIYFVKDHWITSGGYGILLGFSTLPGALLPFIAGHLFDGGNKVAITYALLSLSVLGQILFAVAVYMRVFWFACLAQFVCGSGLNCSTVVQRVLMTSKFEKMKSFSMSCSISIACLGKFIGKVVTAPVVIYLGSFEHEIFFSVLFPLVSLIAGILFFSTSSASDVENITESTIVENMKGHGHCAGAMYTSELERVSLAAPSSSDVSAALLLPQKLAHEAPHDGRLAATASTTAAQDAEERNFWVSLGLLPSVFWCLVAIHATYNTIFHLFNSFLPHLLTDMWRYEVTTAGYLCGASTIVVVFLAPLVGLAVDRTGHGILVCIFFGGLACFGLYLLCVPSPLTFPLVPVIPVLFMAIAEGFIPAITVAVVPTVVPDLVCGVAYGMVTTLDNAMNFGGDVVFGMLRHLTGSYEAGLILLSFFSAFGVALLCVFEYGRGIFNRMRGCCFRGPDAVGARHAYREVTDQP